MPFISNRMRSLTVCNRAIAQGESFASSLPHAPSSATVPPHKQFPNPTVFFHPGDFYESMNDDAKIVSSVCNIVLTGREMGTGNRVPLAGVPYHAVDNYPPSSSKPAIRSLWWSRRGLLKKSQEFQGVSEKRAR